MAIERINSVYDVPALQGEFEFFKKNLQESYEGLVKMYEEIKKYKSVDFKNIAGETQKLSDAMAKAEAQTKKLEEQQRKMEAAMARATMEAIQSRQNNVNLSKSYQDMSGSVEANIKQQIALKKEMEALKKQQKDLQAGYELTGMSTEELTSKQIEVARAIEEVKQASTELGRTIRLQVKEQQAAGGSLDEMKARYDRLFQVFRGLNDSDRDSTIGQQLNKDLEELSAKINEVQKSAGNFSGNVGRYMGSLQPAFQVLTDELQNIRTQLATIDQGAAGFDELIKQEQLLTKLTDGLTKEFSSTTMEVRALQKAAADLGLEFGLGSDVFQKFRDEVGKGVDVVGDIRAQVNLAASDTRALDGMIGAAEGLAGAFSVAEGTAALFGDSSEELMQTMVKLQAVMSVLQGLQAIRNALQKESAAMDFLQTARLKVLTLAQTLYGRAVQASIGAMGQFGKALLLTGIFALIPLLAAGAKALYDFAKASQEAGRQQKLMEEVNSRAIDGYVKQKVQMQALTETVKKGSLTTEEKRQVLIKYNEQFGDSIGKANSFREAEQKIIELGPEYIKTIEMQAKAQAAFDLAVEETKKNLQIAQEGPDVGWFDYLVVGAKQAIGGFDASFKQLQKIQAEQTSESKENANAYLGIFNALNEEITARNKKFGFQNNDQNKTNNKNAEDASKKRKEIAQREAQALFEIEQALAKRRADAAKSIVDNDEAFTTQRLTNLNTYIQESEGIILRNQEFQLKNESLTANERKKIEQETQFALADLTQMGFEKRNQIRAQQLEKEKAEMQALQDELLALPEKIRNDVTQSETERSMTDIFFPNDTELTEKISKLTDAFKKGKMSFEQYQKEVDAINEEYAIKELQRQKNMLQGIISILNARGVSTVKEQQELNDVQRTLDDASAKSHANSEAEKWRATKERLDKTAEAIEAMGQISNNISAAIGELFSISLDRQSVAIEELENRQQQAYENEIRRVNQSTATEEEKANKLKILEAERAAQQQENERKQRRIEVERARFQRASDIANIITSTALAVVRTLAQGGPFAIPLAATVGALGAAQLARAVATPLPRFEKGTRSAPAGWAITDEKGAEMYIEPGGKTYMGNDSGPTMRYLKKGTKVIPANEVNQALQAVMMANTARALQGISNQKNEAAPELKEIRQAIELQTELTLQEMRRKKKEKRQMGFMLPNYGYLQQKTFN